MKTRLFIPLFLVLALINFSCEQEIPLPDNLVEFDATELGFTGEMPSKTITLQFSRPSDAGCHIMLRLTAFDIDLQQALEITPQPVDGIITIPVTAGQTSGSIILNRRPGVFLSGNERIELAIDGTGGVLVVGERRNLKVRFASIVSQGTTMTLQGGAGGASAVNSVFVNFRSNTQTQVERRSWDLGFWTGPEFRVILNHTTAAAAIALNKFDLNQVNVSDTVGVNLTVGPTNPNGMSLIDNVEGDLNRTIIGDVSAIDAENRVFIINRGTGGGIAARPWMKVRILRSGNGYTLQYARITETTFRTIHIPKDPGHNFGFVNFDTGIIKVEPRRANWDIMWTGGVNMTLSGGIELAHYFADQVFINHRAGITAAMVMTSNITWDAFNETHLAGLTMSSGRNIIGSNWRSVRAPIGVFTDRFFVVRDAFGNIYKLRFLNFHTNDGGTRGFPNIEYRLVRRGA